MSDSVPARVVKDYETRRLPNYLSKKKARLHLTIPLLSPQICLTVDASFTDAPV
jgi:hypothetical protein